MRNSRVWLLIAAASMVAVLVFKDSLAQTKTGGEAAPASTRVAVVDVVKVFANYQRAKDLEIKFNERRQAMKTEDNKRTKQLDSLEKELGELNPNSDEYLKRMEEMTRLGMERESWIKFQEAKESQERYRLTDDMYKEMSAAIAQVAKGQNFQVVLASDESSAEAKPDVFRKLAARKVLYADSSLDITDSVLAKLNEAYKASGK